MKLTALEINDIKKSLSNPRMVSWNKIRISSDFSLLNSNVLWNNRVNSTSSSPDELTIKLHQFNFSLCMSMIPTLQIFEILLRNKINDNLKSYTANPMWWKSVNKVNLNKGAIKKIKNAEFTIRNTGRRVNPDRIISELSLGFWVSIFNGEYDNPRDVSKNLWNLTLHKIFQNGVSVSRSTIHSDLEEIRKLRNKVSHNDPILLNDILSTYTKILTLSQYMCPVTSKWIKRNSPIEYVLSSQIKRALVVVRNLYGR